MLGRVRPRTRLWDLFYVAGSTGSAREMRSSSSASTSIRCNTVRPQSHIHKKLHSLAGSRPQTLITFRQVAFAQRRGLNHYNSNLTIQTHCIVVGLLAKVRTRTRTRA